ncbi:hypothetical protein C6P46_001323 [Rhodotorula mucilaginosa]|uniref:Rossman fold oxidoreductase n=1 Tax=Rhodotorula mucilaginosa TaxID=5537 RepID=A0A9P6VVE4_RHOMI|nr:hypothetical protein C6P46_001323 [Rhodotorula mucilaginosa]
MVASVAVIQGAGGSLGSHFCRHLLKRSSLSVVATSRDPSAARRAILDGLDGQDGYDARLKVYEVDARHEETIKKAAQEVEKEFGKKSLRMLINASGVLHADKSIASIDADALLHTFQLNTFAPLLAFKHFFPLLPQKNDVRSSEADDANKDPANGMIHPGLGVLATVTAKIGSIEDNKKGGWYAYRASKAAANQTIMTLQRELSLRSTPSIALALHPGTVVGTNLSKAWTKSEDAGKKPGHFDPETSTGKLLDVIAKCGKEDGGRFRNYDGVDIPW